MSRRVTRSHRTRIRRREKRQTTRPCPPPFTPPPLTEIVYFIYDKQKDPFHNPNVRPSEYFAAIPVSSVDSSTTIRHFFASVLNSVWTITVLITAEDLAAVPFQMQARFKTVGQQAKMSEVLDLRYGGLCFVKEGMCICTVPC